MPTSPKAKALATANTSPPYVQSADVLCLAFLEYQEGNLKKALQYTAKAFEMPDAKLLISGLNDMNQELLALKRQRLSQSRIANAARQVANASLNDEDDDEERVLSEVVAGLLEAEASEDEEENDGSLEVDASETDAGESGEDGESGEFSEQLEVDAATAAENEDDDGSFEVEAAATAATHDNVEQGFKNRHGHPDVSDNIDNFHDRRTHDNVEKEQPDIDIEACGPGMKASLAKLNAKNVAARIRLNAKLSATADATTVPAKAAKTAKATAASAPAKTPAKPVKTPAKPAKAATTSAPAKPAKAPAAAPVTAKLDRQMAAIANRLTLFGGADAKQKLDRALSLQS